MNNTLHRTFNKEVNRYRNSLLFSAKQCDWESFKRKAGNLFDYIESVEMKEIERKFFKIFKIILSILFFAVFFIISIDPHASPGTLKLKDFMTIAAVAGCCYELYSFMNFSFFMNQKKKFYEKRRKQFIYNIQGDFRDIIVPAVIEEDDSIPEVSSEPEQVLQHVY